MTTHPTPTRDEGALRRSLGIPSDADRVMIFAESSHWDPNWLMTSEGYYERFVRRNLDLAIAELGQQPRRVYSIECVFFLRMYWDRHPEQQGAVRALVNERRLRLTGSGVTTADTLLPSPEALLRDWLVGQEWLRAQGMEQEPTLAYFADSFGASPAIPSLLRAAGFDRTAITRVDGMSSMGADYETPSHFPRPGSTAERLLEQERTLDFYWRDAAGAQVLCHWNAFTYGQGDLLASRGVSRLYLVPLFLPDASERNVARRIASYVRQLEPYRRTPYMLCPIGYDFVPPIPDLVGLLDRYNRIRYPETGVWTVNAGIDDYLDLIGFYPHALPVFEIDPNPYWMGFYTARPALKERCYALVDALLLAEGLGHLPDNADTRGALAEELAAPWWEAVTANHHDLITGTSPDHVVDAEQMPALQRAQRAVAASIEARAARTGSARPAAQPSGKLAWRREGTLLTAHTPHLALELDAQSGGVIARAWEPGTGRPLLNAPSADVVRYRGSGGPYRMGHEFLGGWYRQEGRASTAPAELSVREVDGGLEIAAQVEVAGDRCRRILWLPPDAPAIHVCLEASAPDRRTIALRFDPVVWTQDLVMDAPGGMVVRSPKRWYDPTFWPIQHLLFLREMPDGAGLAFWQRRPGAVSYAPDAGLEAIAVRNATRERVLGIFPLPANPATAHDRGVHAFHCALLFTPPGAGLPADIQAALGSASPPWLRAAPQTLRDIAPALVKVGEPAVRVLAIKPASRGEGTIVRLYAPRPPSDPVALSFPCWSIRAAVRCDARERDLEPLAVEGKIVRLSMEGTIATLRLLTR
ncbi:MAG: hypothetical protein JXA09_05375 [Anaerolineae bacterium]|nr:hypothetical protein [Anaerolineae bacterium]